MYFISKILWSQVFPREMLRNLQFLTRKNMEIFALSPAPTPSLLFLVLIYWLK